MEIYIMRHGDAVDRNDPGITSDETRPLTDAGRAEIALMAELLGDLGVRPDLVLTSPLVRARQTAAIVADRIGRSSEAVACAELAPGGSPAGVLHDILRHGRLRQVVLVGHMPGVGTLPGVFAWNRRDCLIPFRTAGVCRVDLPDDAPNPGAGRLRWLLPPMVGERLSAR